MPLICLNGTVVHPDDLGPSPPTGFAETVRELCDVIERYKRELRRLQDENARLRAGRGGG